jgi:2-polyprenyl-3-methyl-5-hydroxy-6-metoxy-1,4-benzoquinol methylase
MRNQEKWKASKYIYQKGRLIASRDPKEVAMGSRLIADLVAGFYDRNLRLHAKGRLLDLACGTVPLYGAYRGFVTDNICVDWSNTPHKSEYLDYELDLTEGLPFGDNSFDTIILSDVLEHIPVPDRLWREMARVLSVNGRVIANVPFYYWVHEQPYDYFRYTEFALRRFVQTSGLRVIQLQRIGGAPEVITDIFAKTILRVPKVGQLLALLAQWVTSVFIRTSLGKKVSQATSPTFPLGYFLVAEKPLHRAQAPVAIEHTTKVQTPPAAFVAKDYWSDRHRRLPGLQATGTLGGAEQWQRWLYRGKKIALRTLLKRNRVLPLQGPVLDFGCGNGFFEDVWESWGASQADGIDLVDEVIEDLRKRHPDRRYLASDLSSGFAILEGWGPYELITGVDVFYHVIDDRALLGTLEMLRSRAMPRGWFLFTDQLLDRHPAPHVRFRSLEQWRRLLARIDAELSGFEPMFVVQNRPGRMARLLPRLAGAGALTIDLAARRMFPWAANNRAVLARFR